MDRSYLANTLIAFSITITTWILWSFGESRVDAYTSLYTFEYLMIKLILNPRRVYADIPLLILLAIFTVTVIYRIWEVLKT